MNDIVIAVLDFVVGLPPPLIYLTVGALAFGETAILLDLVVPGEVSMVLAGVLAAYGPLSLPAMIAAAAVGATLGDSTGYFIGRRWGPDLVYRWRFTRRAIGRRLPRARGFFTRHGGKAIFVGRFIGPLRSIVPLVAGAARMSFRRFFPWNVAASIAWTGTVIGLGFIFGPYILRAVEKASFAISVTVAAAFALGLTALLLHRHRRRAHEAA